MKRAASQPTCSYNLRDKSVKPQKYKPKPSQQSVLETPRVTDRLPTRRPLDQTMADTFRGEDTFADTTTRPQGEVIRGNHSSNQTIVVLSPQTQKNVDEGHMSLGVWEDMDWSLLKILLYCPLPYCPLVVELSL